MSNRRYGLEETEFEKLDIRLLYITQARYDTDCIVLHIRIILLNYFMSFMVVAFFL